MEDPAKNSDGNNQQKEGPLLLSNAMKMNDAQAQIIAQFQSQMASLQRQLDEVTLQLQQQQGRNNRPPHNNVRNDNDPRQSTCGVVTPHEEEVKEEEDDDDDDTRFEIYVQKDTFKFNAAHFVAYPGFRERLHGHNYRVGIRLIGRSKIGGDGYVLDFGCVKTVTKDVCKKMNEYFAVPMRSDVLKITVDDVDVDDDGEDGVNHGGNDNSTVGQLPPTTTKKRKNNDGKQQQPRRQSSVTIITEEGSMFVFPRQDCLLLPIMHTTAEEFAIYLYGQILAGLDAGYLLERGVRTMEVTVAEANGQEAVFRKKIPSLRDGKQRPIDVAEFVSTAELPEMKCGTATTGVVIERKKG